MSAHFLDTDLYGIIKDNDLVQLDRALFFLGARIHVIEVWCGRTAMVYAARLGHLQQAKILLDDLDRYSTWGRNIAGYVIKLFIEALPHRQLDPDFFIRLVQRFDGDPTKYKNNDWDTDPYIGAPIRALVQGEAFDLIEILMKEENSDVYIPEVIKYCFQFGKRRVFHMSESVQQHPAFLRELQEKHETDPLELAIMRGDTDEVGRLLKTIADSEDRCRVPSVMQLGKRITTTAIDGLCYQQMRRFVDIVIGLDDVNMFRKLVDNDTLEHTLAVTGLPAVNLLIGALRVALYEGCLTIVPVILNHCRFNRLIVKWTDLYYDLLVKVKVKSAATIKHMAGDRNQFIRGRLYNKHGNKIRALDHVEPDTSVQSMLELVGAIDSLPRKRPGPNSHWRKSVTTFPFKHGRPDLVQAFQRYGCSLSEIDILNSMAQSSCGGMNHEKWDVKPNVIPERLPNPLTKDNLCEIFFGDTSSSNTTRILVPLLLAYDTKTDHELLIECILESGIGVGLEENLSRSHAVVEEESPNIPLVRTPAVVSLKKLCRLSVRNSTRATNPGKSLTDSILSFYVDEHLPKTLVKYLLYREENVHQPLYCRLVSPRHRVDVDSALSSDDYLDFLADIPFAQTYDSDSDDGYYYYYDSDNDRRYYDSDQNYDYSDY